MQLLRTLRRSFQRTGSRAFGRELRRERLWQKFGPAFLFSGPTLEQQLYGECPRTDFLPQTWHPSPDECPDLMCSHPDQILLYCMRWDFHLTGRARRIEGDDALESDLRARNREARSSLFLGLVHEFTSPILSWAAPTTRILDADFATYEFKKGRYLGLTSRGQHLFVGVPENNASPYMHGLPEEFRSCIFGVLMIGGPICTLAQS